MNGLQSKLASPPIPFQGQQYPRNQTPHTRGQTPPQYFIGTQEADPQGTQFPGISFQTPLQYSTIQPQFIPLFGYANAHDLNKQAYSAPRMPVGGNSSQAAMYQNSTGVRQQPYYNQTSMQPSSYQISQPQASQGLYTQQQIMFMPPPQYSAATQQVIMPMTASSYPQRMSSPAYQNSMPNTQQGLFQLPQQNTANYTPHAHTHTYNNPPAVFYNAAQQNRPPSASGMSGPGQLPAKKRERTVFQIIDPNSGKDIMQDFQQARSTPPSLGTLGSHGSGQEFQVPHTAQNEIAAQFAAHVAQVALSSCPGGNQPRIVPDAEENKKDVRGKKKAKDINRKGEMRQGSEMDAFKDLHTKSEVSTSITENEDQDQNSTKAKTSHKMFATIGLQSSHMETEDSWLRSSSEEDEIKSKNKAQDSSLKAKIDKNKKQNSSHTFKRKKDSKKKYDRKFLLKLQNAPQSMKKPADLPDIPEIIIEKPSFQLFPRDFAGVGNIADFTTGYIWTVKIQSTNSRQGKDAPWRGINLENNIGLLMQKDSSLHTVDGSRKSPRVDEEQKRKPSKSEDSILRAKRENQKQKTTKAEAHDKKVGTVGKPSTHVDGEKHRSNSSLEEHKTKLDNQTQVASHTKKSKKNKKQKAVLRSKKEECSPIIPDSKKRYDRKFILKLQNAPQSMIKPAGLPDIPEIIIEKPSFQLFPQDFTDVGNIADFTTRYVWTVKNQLTHKAGTGHLGRFRASIEDGSRSQEVERSYLPINRFSALSNAHKTDDKDSHRDRWRGYLRAGLQDTGASEESQREKSTNAAKFSPWSSLADKSQDDGSNRGGQQGRFGRPGPQVNHPSQELQTEIDIAAAKLSEEESGGRETERAKTVEKPSTPVQELTDDQMLSKTRAIMDEYLHIQDVEPQYSHSDNGGSKQNIKQENNEILSTQKDTNLNHVEDGTRKSTQEDAEGDEVEVEEDQNNETSYPSQPSIQPPNNPSQPSIQPPNNPSQSSIQPPNYPSQSSIQPPNYPSQPSIQPLNNPSQPSIQPPNNPSQPSIQPPNNPSQPSIQPPNNPSQSSIQPPNYPSQFSIQPPNYPSQPSIKPPNYPSQPSIQPPNNPSQPSIQPPNNPSQPSIQPPNNPSQPSIQPPNNPSQPSIQPPNYPSQSSIQPPNNPSQPSIQPPNYPSQPSIQPPNNPSQTSIQPPNNPSQTSIQPPRYPSQPSIQPPSYPISPSIQPPNNPSQPSIQPPSYPISPSIQSPCYPSQPSIQPPSYPISPSIQPPCYPSQPSIQPPGYPISPSIQSPCYPSQPSIQLSYSSHPSMQPPSYSMVYPQPGQGMYISPQHMITPQPMLSMPQVHYSSTGTQVRMPLSSYPNHLNMQPMSNLMGQPLQVYAAPQQRTTSPPQQMIMPQHQQMTIPQHQQMAAQQYQNMTTPQQQMTTPQKMMFMPQAQYSSVGTQAKITMNKCLPSKDDNNQPGDQINGKEVQEEQNCILMLPGLLPDKSQEENTSVEGPDEQSVQSHLSSDNGQRVIQSQEPSSSRKSLVKSPEWDVIQLEKEKLKLEIEFIKVKYKKIIEETEVLKLQKELLKLQINHFS